MAIRPFSANSFQFKNISLSFAASTMKALGISDADVSATIAAAADSYPGRKFCLAWTALGRGCGSMELSPVV